MVKAEVLKENDSENQMYLEGMVLERMAEPSVMTREKDSDE